MEFVERIVYLLTSILDSFHMHNLNLTESGERFGEFYHVKEVIGREELIACEHYQPQSIIFPCIWMLIALDARAGGKATATQCHFFNTFHEPYILS